jgi:hypothetical protein
LPTGKLEFVHLEGFYVAAAWFDGSRWTVRDADE